MVEDKLFSRQYGTPDKPALLVLHGLLGSSKNWQQQAKLLQDEFYIVALDLPNHGYSPPLPNMDYTSLANIVNNRVKKHFTQPIALLGHSMGGKVAIKSAETQPELYSKLIIVDIAPIAYPLHHQQLFKALQQLDLKTLKNRKQADEQLKHSIAQQSIRNFLLHSLEYKKQHWQWLFDLQNLSHNQAQIAAAPSLQKIIPVKTLVIKGEKSHYIQPDSYPVFQQYFPQLYFKMIANAGHWPHIEKARVFSHMLKRFLLQ